MTDVAEPESAPADEPPAAEVEPPAGPTVFALRRAHVELLQAWPGLDDEARHARAEAFRGTLAAAGAYLEEGADRDAAQAMIDYWTATLAALPSHEGFPTLIELAPFDAANRPDLKKTAGSPFVGLNAFGVSDRDRFFGRLCATDQLVQRVIEEPLVIVAGPSGSGKSSLVFAGLLPKLADYGNWRVLPPLTPGNDPVAALLQPFRPADAAPDWLDTERANLAREPARLAALAKALSPNPVMLVIDQGEEVFTFGAERASRRLFFAAVGGLLTAGCNHHVVITVRGDFLRELSGIDALFAGEDRAAAVYTVEALTSRELHDAIVGPSLRIGLKIDPRVVEDLVREVVGEPAALPLLQFTLTRLWGKAEGDRITCEDYARVGRPADALRQAAEEIWERLSLRENHDAAKLIFLELVRPSTGSESVRGGRVRREALRKLAAADRIDRVLARFAAAGLIRRTPGVDADDDRFEVAHETLIRQWPRLVGWLEERRRDNEQVDRLMASAELWRQSGDTGYLLGGTALREAGLAVAANPGLADYVRASRNWRYQRLWRVGLIAAAVAVTFASLFLLWLSQRRDTSTQKERAEQEAGRAVDADIAGAAAWSHAQIAEQTLTRMIAGNPALLALVPAPLVPRVAAAPFVPSAGWLGRARGYDPVFLGPAVPLPASTAPVRILPYVNFSVAYDPAAQVLRYVISNFDRTALPVAPLAATPFAPDPRVEADQQAAPFAGLDVTQGRVPLATWREIGWQPAGGGLAPRNDLLPVTAVLPWLFEQGRWNALQQSLFGIAADRITFITGPVLDGGAGGKVPGPPRAFWKVALYRDPPPGATLHADAYLVPVEEPRTLPSVRSYRVGLDALSRLVGIDFRLPQAAAADAAAPEPAAQKPAAVATTAQVYLQFAQMSRGDARRISDALAKLGYHVPGEERVQLTGLHEVRYYYRQDAELAAALASAAQGVLAAQGYGTVTVAPRLLVLKAGTRLPKPGVLELWLTIPPPAAGAG